MESKNYQDDLSHIRQMMERSSRFISLSGISGVFAGFFALLGAGYAYWLLFGIGIYGENSGENINDLYRKTFVLDGIVGQLILVAILVLIAAIGAGVFFTMRKSKKNNLKVWDKTTKKLLFNFAVPLATGGLFCAGILFHGLHALLSPATLIFYGLALFNAGNYTFSDVKYLGICQIVLGIISLFFLGYGLFFWAIGFGVLHIVYGIIMHKKYR